jgi:hypothetical protein
MLSHRLFQKGFAEGHAETIPPVEMVALSKASQHPNKSKHKYSVSLTGLFSQVARLSPALCSLQFWIKPIQKIFHLALLHLPKVPGAMCVPWFIE